MARSRRAWARLRATRASTLLGPLQREVDRAEQWLSEDHPEEPAAVVREAALVAGLSGAMMGVRLLRLLPGLPFLPGHKAVLLLPLYLFGAAKGAGRFTATSVGLVVGLLSFMQGDGRYGALEVLKHVAPGLLADLLWPIARRAPGPLLLRTTLLGLVLALGRLSIELGLSLIMGAPGAVFSVLVGVGWSHLLAGGLSGALSAALLRQSPAPPSGGPADGDPAAQ